MTEMTAPAENCQGVTSEATGNYYGANSRGMINVTDSSDVVFFKRNGFGIAGGMARTGKYWICDPCGWEANLNHCRYCDSENLRKVEG